jgi:hypothetical protein
MREKKSSHTCDVEIFGQAAWKTEDEVQQRWFSEKPTEDKRWV